MENINKRLAEIKNEIIGGIIALLKKNAIFEADFALSCTPIIFEDPYDDNNSFTLDRVYLDGNAVVIDASSCSENLTRNAEELSLDILDGILEFLEDYEGEIWNKDPEATVEAIVEAVMEEYNGQGNCMGDFLSMNSLQEILGEKHSELLRMIPELSAERLAGIYMELKKAADGDEFYRENDCSDERVNILDNSREELSSRDKVFVLFNEVNNDGVHESDVVGTYRNVEDAKAEMKLRRDKFMEELSEDDQPKPDEGDDFIDDDKHFLYYRFNDNHLFSLVVKETTVL